MSSKIRTILRRGAVTTAAAALLAVGLVDFEAAPASAYQGVVTAWTPGTYTWTVPEGVTQISVKTYGAQGGGVAEFGDGVGGHGAWLEALVPVTAGQVLTYVVGGQPVNPNPRAGGYGGGGAGADAFFGRGAGGGGASYVSLGTAPLVVAGGGGGAANGVDGGDSGQVGGSLAGSSIANGRGGLPGTPPGAMHTPGGVASGLGADCRYREDGVAGAPGASFQGGAGGGRSDTYENYGGGGGGGGYYGGAGGGGGAYCAFWDAEHAAAGGGGGGSSYVAKDVELTLFEDGQESGNGAVVIQY